MDACREIRIHFSLSPKRFLTTFNQYILRSMKPLKISVKTMLNRVLKSQKIRLL